MALARKENYDIANRILSEINLQSANNADCNLTSDLLHLEDLYCDVLNEIYGLNLINANTLKKNYSGIDLIDVDSCIAVQVTADTSYKKMHETFKKPVMEDLAKENFTIKFCYVGEQNKNTKRRNPPNPYGVCFDSSKDSILTSDILNRFKHLDLDSQERVLAILKRETKAGCMLSAEWMNGLLKREIKLLGPRYMPDANVETADMKKFSALLATPEFRAKIIEQAEVVKQKKLTMTKSIKKVKDKETVKRVLDYFSLLVPILGEVPSESVCPERYEDFAKRLVEAFEECSSYSSSLYALLDEEPSATIKDFYYSVRELENTLFEYGVSYLKTKIILVKGEAGIGKSHLLADLCESSINNGNAAILLLGSQFIGSRTSEEAIPELVNFSGSLDELLSELQRYSAVRDRVAFLVIDALNEGEGRSFWRDSLPGLIGLVKHYSNVRLVLSCRTTYFREIIPDCIYEGEDYQVIECDGFKDISWSAVQILCDYYGVAYPLTPLIGIEFSNPLYLNLACKYAKKHGGRFSGNIAMGDLVTAFFQEKNDILSGYRVLNYDSGIDLVWQVVYALVSSPSYSYGSIKYEEASSLTIPIVRDYVGVPGNFLPQLISEGIFNVFLSGSVKYLTFSFELIGNFAAAYSLASEAKDRTGRGEFRSSEDALGILLSSNWEWASQDQGMLAALSTVAPSMCKCEVFDIHKLVEEEDCLVAAAFVEGLPWRKIDEVSEGMSAYIDSHVFRYEYTMREFLNSSFQLATKKTGINCEYFCDILLRLNMSDRDYAWSSMVAQSPSAKSFIEWSWENGSKIDDGTAEPIAMMLVLCLSATNIILRRESIKALALILINRPYLALSLWSRFLNVDDDYILEGLTGAFYGALVNSENQEEWKPIVDAVCSKIISDGTAYPNFIVRDYTMLMHDALVGNRYCEEDYSTPFESPFKSDWYEVLPSNEDIDMMVESFEEKYGKDSHEALEVKWIVYSMTTEYGRGTCCYGDFGRYTFGTSVSEWANQFNSDQDLSNALIKHILENWYMPELHAEYDREVRRFQGYAYSGCERIGKKYQKIALNRLLARLVDNFPPFQIKTKYKKGYEEYSKKRAELFMAALSSRDFSNLPSSDEYSDWKIGEIAVPFDESDVGFELLYTRSQDPSFPWKWSKLEMAFDIGSIFPTVVSLEDDAKKWCSSELEYQAVNNYRQVLVDSKRYYTLSTFKEWKCYKSGRRSREAAWISNAVFCKSEDKDEVFAGYFDTHGGLNFSYVRFGECFSGWGYSLVRSINRSERDAIEQKVFDASYHYDWGDDISELGEKHSVYLPGDLLVEHFGLVRRGPFDWVTKDGTLVSMCLADHETEDRVLLFDADLLDSFLKEKNMEIIWDEYFEKQTASYFYRKWTHVVQEEGSYRFIDSNEPYFGNIDRREWMADDAWIDA